MSEIIVNNKSVVDNTHPCYDVFKGYFDVKKEPLLNNTTVCYSLTNSDEIFYGYIVLKDFEYEGYILKDFPFIKLKNGGLLQSSGKNCVRVS